MYKDGGSSSGDRRVLRIYDSCRTAHLERLAVITSGELIYRKRSYDFDEVSIPDGTSVHRRSRLGIVLALVRARSALTIEINEPAQVNSWPTTAAILVGVMARRFFGRRTILVAYAIDNGDVGVGFSSYFPLFFSGMAHWVGVAIFRCICERMDRIVFGTCGAREHYSRYTDVSSYSLVEAVPSAHLDCSLDARRPVVLFLGSLESRKGVVPMTKAFGLMQKADPSIEFVIAGLGPLEGYVRGWLRSADRTELVIDPCRRDQRVLLESARVLVLFSQPTGRWREQVGLPIVEGLAHGCTIVASEQTGLRDWLNLNGHTIVPHNADPQFLADQILRALADPIDPSEVQRSLPMVDGRVMADLELFSGLT